MGDSSATAFVKFEIATTALWYTFAADQLNLGIMAEPFTQDVTPGPTAGYAIVADPSVPAYVNGCGKATVIVTDAYGNAGSSRTSSSNTVFYSDLNCQTKITKATIPAGQKSPALYFKDAVYEQIKIIPSTSSGSLQSEQNSTNPALITQDPGPGLSSFKVVGPSTVSRGVCTPWSLQMLQQDGNTVGFTSAKFSINLSGGSAVAQDYSSDVYEVVYTDASCTHSGPVVVNASTTATTFYTKVQGKSGWFLHFSGQDPVGVLLQTGAGFYPIK